MHNQNPSLRIKLIKSSGISRYELISSFQQEDQTSDKYKKNRESFWNLVFFAFFWRATK